MKNWIDGSIFYKNSTWKCIFRRNGWTKVKQTTSESHVLHYLLPLIVTLSLYPGCDQWWNSQQFAHGQIDLRTLSYRIPAPLADLTVRMYLMYRPSFPLLYVCMYALLSSLWPNPINHHHQPSKTKFCISTAWVDLVIDLKRYPNWSGVLEGRGVNYSLSQWL